jgi:predicted P-loop ATPase/GTPase
MTTKALARMIINSITETDVEKLNRQISYLQTCYFHSNNVNLQDDIQQTIYYLMDKVEKIKG